MPAHAIILASGSPRRRDLLASAGVQLEVRPSQVPEDRVPGEPPGEYALRMARDKCAAEAGEAAARGDPRPVLAADTIVVLAGRVLGKPAHRREARQMIRGLAGRDHEVITAYCIRAGEHELERAVTTRVTFRPLDPEEIEAYLDGEDWVDKAGAYGIQGHAAHMAREVHGSYSNVVGLPLSHVVEDLKELPR